MTDWVDEAIKVLAKETADLTEPESFQNFCLKICARLHRNGNTLYAHVRKRMRNIDDIAYLDELQMVQLLFVFKQPVNARFKDRLRKEGHEVELNKLQQIVRFRSKDGEYSRSHEETNDNRRMSTQSTQTTQDTSNIYSDSPDGQDLPNDGGSGDHDDDLVIEQKPMIYGGPGTPNFPVFVHSPVKEEPTGDFENEQNSGGSSSSVRDGTEEAFVDDPMTPGSENEILLTPEHRQLFEKFITENYSHGVTEQQRKNIEARFASLIQAKVSDRVSEAQPAREVDTTSKRRQEPDTVDAKRSKSSDDGAENSESTSQLQTTPHRAPAALVPILTLSESSVSSVRLFTPTASTPAPYNQQISALQLAELLEAIGCSLSHWLFQKRSHWLFQKFKTFADHLPEEVPSRNPLRLGFCRRWESEDLRRRVAENQRVLEQPPSHCAPSVGKRDDGEQSAIHREED